MMTIGVCDDMPLYLTQLKTIFGQLASEVGIEVKVVTCESGEALLEIIRNKPEFFDIVFLDIYMDETAMTGIETAKQIRKVDTTIPIVFATSSAEHAVESYRMNAFDYLLKPYTRSSVKVIFEKILSYKQEIKQKTLLVKSGQNLYTIDLRKVVYFESSLRTITVHFNDKRQLTFYKKLAEIEADVANLDFMRTHRSYLVNLLYVQNIIESDVITIYQELIPISKKYHADVKASFTDYIYQK
ncbi:MAG: LytR/AlgR family response regulator transcription factor [Culicoidibacterales bacterium]